MFQTAHPPLSAAESADLRHCMPHNVPVKLKGVPERAAPALPEGPSIYQIVTEAALRASQAHEKIATVQEDASSSACSLRANSCPRVQLG